MAPKKKANKTQKPKCPTSKATVETDSESGAEPDRKSSRAAAKPDDNDDLQLKNKLLDMPVTIRKKQRVESVEHIVTETVTTVFEMTSSATILQPEHTLIKQNIPQSILVIRNQNQISPSPSQPKPTAAANSSSIASCLGVGMTPVFGTKHVWLEKLRDSIHSSQLLSSARRNSISTDQRYNWGSFLPTLKGEIKIESGRKSKHGRHSSLQDANKMESDSKLTASLADSQSQIDIGSNPTIDTANDPSEVEYLCVGSDGFLRDKSVEPSVIVVDHDSGIDRSVTARLAWWGVRPEPMLLAEIESRRKEEERKKEEQELQRKAALLRGSHPARPLPVAVSISDHAKGPQPPLPPNRARPPVPRFPASRPTMQPGRPDIGTFGASRVDLYPSRPMVPVSYPGPRQYPQQSYSMPSYPPHAPRALAPPPGNYYGISRYPTPHSSTPASMPHPPPPPPQRRIEPPAPMPAPPPPPPGALQTPPRMTVEQRQPPSRQPAPAVAARTAGSPQREAPLAEASVPSAMQVDKYSAAPAISYESRIDNFVNRALQNRVSAKEGEDSASKRIPPDSRHASARHSYSEVVDRSNGRFRSGDEFRRSDGYPNRHPHDDPHDKRNDNRISSSDTRHSHDRLDDRRNVRPDDRYGRGSVAGAGYDDRSDGRQDESRSHKRRNDDRHVDSQKSDHFKPKKSIYERIGKRESEDDHWNPR